MDITRFVFGFLYTRNWHSGEHELSRPRVAVFAGALFLLILGLVIISFLQAPLNYSVQ